MAATVHDCLTLPELSPAHVVAGAQGLSRRVRLAHVVDEPDLAHWSAPEIIILTTAHNQPSDNPLWSSLIQDLVNQGVAGLFIAVGRYLTQVPESAIQEANTLGLPLVTIPWELPFITVTDAIHRLILKDAWATWARLSEVQIQVTQTAARAPSLNALLSTFSRLFNRPLSLINADQDTDRTGRSLFSLGTNQLADAYLVVDGEDLSPLDKIVARQMAGVLAIFLLQQKLAQRTEYEIQATVVDRILAGDFEDSPLNQQRLNLWGFHPDRNHQVIILSLPDHPQATDFSPSNLEVARQLIQEDMANRNFLSTIIPGAMVLLTRPKPIHPQDPTFPGFFHRFSRSAGLISPPVSLADTPTTFRTMLKMMPLLPPGGMHNLSQVVFPAIVADLPVEPMTALANATWHRLHDKVLKETLEALVECGGVRLEAAKRLGVHRNTIANRILQLESLLNHPLDSDYLGQLDLCHRWLKTRPWSPL